MKKNNLTIVVFIAASMLAAMGCWFCWRFPMEWLWGENQHHLFMRQLYANLMGCAVFAGAWALGWRRWMKARRCQPKPFVLRMSNEFQIVKSVIGRKLE